jgi:hypothetical protein
MSHLVATMNDKNSNRQAWNSNWKMWLKAISEDKLNLWSIVEDSDLLQDEEQSRSIKKDLQIFALSTFLDALCGTIFNRRAVKITAGRAERRSEEGAQNGA